MSEQNQAMKDELLKLLEENAHGDVSISTAISLKRIADRLNAEPAKAPPGIVHRGI
jgi:hypothetical protein